MIRADRGSARSLFLGSDGVTPIDFLILVGHGNRVWLEPHYFDPGIEPIGRLKAIIPARPDLPEEDLLLDAVLAFAPAYFGDRCPSLAVVAAVLKDAESLYFDLAPEVVPRRGSHCGRRRDPCCAGSASGAPI